MEDDRDHDARILDLFATIQGHAEQIAQQQVEFSWDPAPLQRSIGMTQMAPPGSRNRDPLLVVRRQNLAMGLMGVPNAEPERRVVPRWQVRAARAAATSQDTEPPDLLRMRFAMIDDDEASAEESLPIQRPASPKISPEDRQIPQVTPSVAWRPAVLN